MPDRMLVEPRKMFGTFRTAYAVLFIALLGAGYAIMTEAPQFDHISTGYILVGAALQLFRWRKL